VTRSGTIVEVVYDGAGITWLYQFDLAAGGLPIRVEGGGSADPISESWKNRYESVDGVWLPAYVEFENRSPTVVLHREMTWSGHELNRPVDPAEFSVAALDPRPGDRVRDVRSNSEYMVDRDEYARQKRGLAAVNRKVVGATPPVTAASRWRMIVGANLIVLTVVVLLLWTRSRRKARSIK
jgi:hypothetical protein